MSLPPTLLLPMKTLEIAVERWPYVMIRRTYASPNLKYLDKNIGEVIAVLKTRRIICEFNLEEDLDEIEVI